jgi:voltage-gated potassium channel
MLDFIKKKIWIWKINYEVSDEDKNTIFEHTETNLWLWANYTIIFLILLSVIIVWLDTLPWFNQKYWFEIFIIDFFISTIFLFEYIYRWKHSDHKKEFPFRIMNLFDLLSFLPFFVLIALYWYWSYWIFVLFRIFRVLRIYELVERIPIVRKIWKWIIKNKIEYLTAIFVILIILTIFSTLAYLFEQKWWNATWFSSIPETFWWAVVTFSTTWYWNIIPMSLGWKVIASLLMVLWPILITILSTITVIIFIDSTKIINIKMKNIKCEHCGSENESDAKFCDKCWKEL